MEIVHNPGTFKSFWESYLASFEAVHGSRGAFCSSSVCVQAVFRYLWCLTGHLFQLSICITMKVQSLLFSPLILVQHLIEWKSWRLKLYKLQAAGVGGSLLDVIHNFLSDRTQRVVMDGIKVVLLMLFLVFLRVVSWARYCSVYILLVIYLWNLSMSLLVMLMTPHWSLMCHIPLLGLPLLVLSTVILRV